MSFISSCSCDSLYSTLCFYITRIFSTSHTCASLCRIFHRLHKTSFRFITHLILRALFTSSLLSNIMLHFCNNFSHLFFVMCFTFYLGFYFHVFTFMSSKLHCYFSDYNRSLIQLSYSTSYTSLICFFYSCDRFYTTNFLLTYI